MSNIYLRQSTWRFARIIDIIDGAKKPYGTVALTNGKWVMARSWNKIFKKICYVLILEGEVVGVAALQQGDKNYQDMTSGNGQGFWCDLSAIHRCSWFQDTKGNTFRPH